MNVLYITQWFSYIGGGGEVQFINLINAMANKGHRVHVICQRLSNSEISNEIENLHIHRVKPIIRNERLNLNQNMRFIINAVYKGSKLIKDERIDIIHVNNFSPVIAGSILSKIFNIPIIKTIHAVYCTSPDFWRKWSSQNNASSMLWIVGPLFEKITIRLHADIIHAVSNATKMDILKVNAKSKITVIPNGVDLSIYDNLKLNIDYQKYVVFIGRLVVNKNLDIVISSFKDVIITIPEAKLIVIGSGPKLDEWKNMVSDMGLSSNIEFTGYISQEDKMDLLSKCSALVLPSTVEGQPIAALEALAMSKPLLLSDIEPSYEIVTEGVDGFILPTNDARKWAERITFLLSRKDVCEKMGREGRLKVEKKYNIKRLLDNVETTYHRLQRLRE
jgi:glycosyltransferase involved in cell wall biosynthesis